MLADAFTITVLIVLYQALRIYYYFLIGSVLLSWLPEIRNTKIGQIIERIANPYLRLFRGLIVVGMFDFTPIIGFILYNYGLNMFGQMINMMASS